MSLRDKAESLRQSAELKEAPEVEDKSLSQRELAKRLKTDSRQLQKRRDDAANLAQWTKAKDPDGIAWVFKAEKYFPLDEAQR